jgi:hypothetical protein
MTKTKTMKAETRGRKPIKDKKKQVTIYVQESTIKKNGGLDKTKSKLIDYLTITGILLLCIFGENIINSII